jgi:hypothetical protein
MLGTYSATPALPWPAALPRRHTRQPARPSTGRQAALHGVRAAIRSICLAAAVLAASGTVGAARGPVVLSEPRDGAAQVEFAPATAVGPIAVYGVVAAPRTR